MTFKKALCLSLIPLTLIPIFILGISTLKITEDSVEENSVRLLEELAKSSGDSLVNYIEAQKREIVLISNLIRVKECLVAHETKTMTDKIITAGQNALSSWVSADKYYNSSYLLDEKGDVIVSSNGLYRNESFASHEIYKEFDKEEITFSEIRDSFLSEDEKVIYITSPVHAEDFTGMLVMESSLEFYDSLVVDLVFDDTGAAFIVDRNGVIISHSIREVRDTSLVHPEYNMPFKNFGEGKTQKYGIHRYEYQGQQRMAGYYIVDNVDWVLFTRQDLDEINKPINRMLMAVISMFITVSIISVIACVVLIKSFTRPIQKLREAFQRATDESDYIVCEVVGHNEFSELAHGYNKMIKRLDTKESELQYNYDLLSKEQEKTNYLAMHDYVTDLYNLRAFEIKMNEVLISGESGAVFYLGLDEFKNVNNVFGHKIGDLCLKESAKRIMSLSNNNELVARTGGDEFYLIKLGDEEAIDKFANDLLMSFKTPFVFDSIQVNLSASIGIALFPTDAVTTIEIMKCADTAMYEAKRSGKGKYSYYNEQMTVRLNRSNEILDILESVIIKGESYMAYQPEVNLSGEDIIAFEALMRVNSKNLGMIAPNEFIPLAESSGKIISIGEWVIESAALFVKELLERGQKFDYISVNISTVQLGQANFVDMVLNIIDKIGIEPKYILLEITESVFMSESSRNVEKLSILRDKGIKIALDDFGTGYSSMQYLADLPVDFLKIDKCFIDEIAFNEKKRGIVKVIIDMAHYLGMQVVAEGVETKEQLDILKRMDCDIIQGYYYYKPMKQEDILEVLYKINEY